MRTYWLVLSDELEAYDQEHGSVELPGVVLTAGESITLSRKASQRRSRSGRKSGSGQRATSDDAMVGIAGDATRRGSARASIFSNMFKRHRSSNDSDRGEAAPVGNAQGSGFGGATQDSSASSNQDTPVLALDQEACGEELPDAVSIAMPESTIGQYRLRPVRESVL